MAPRLLPPRRGAVAFLALFAFLFQAFAGATHWHLPQGAMLAAAHVSGGDASGDPQKAPVKSEPCQLCQAMSGAARYITAGGLALHEPHASVFAWQIADTAAAIRLRLSHDWRGRAPPPALLT